MCCRLGTLPPHKFHPPPVLLTLQISGRRWEDIQYTWEKVRIGQKWYVTLFCFCWHYSTAVNEIWRLSTALSTTSFMPTASQLSRALSTISLASHRLCQWHLWYWYVTQWHCQWSLSYLLPTASLNSFVKMSTSSALPNSFVNDIFVACSVRYVSLLSFQWSDFCSYSYMWLRHLVLIYHTMLV